MSTAFGKRERLNAERNKAMETLIEFTLRGAFRRVGFEGGGP
jgi:hypothetical protein